MERLALGIVVAVSKNGGIGKNNTLPWKIPEDLKRFRAVTLKHAVIMGRATYESIGKPLVDRRNIVVTQTRSSFPGCEVAPSLAEALKTARSSDTMPMVIGGARLYAEALPQATHLFLTEIDQDFDCDTFFPLWNRAEWKEVARDAGATPGVSFVNLERRPMDGGDRRG